VSRNFDKLGTVQNVIIFYPNQSASRFAELRLPLIIFSDSSIDALVAKGNTGHQTGGIRRLLFLWLIDESRT